MATERSNGTTVFVKLLGFSLTIAVFTAGVVVWANDTHRNMIERNESKFCPREVLDLRFQGMGERFDTVDKALAEIQAEVKQLR